MLKFVKKVMAIVLVLSLCGLGVLLADRQKLNKEIVRMHVVANSDSAEDQNIKLQVRDALLAYIEKNMQNITNAQQAKAYLKEHLAQLEQAANTVLCAFGDDRAKVSLTKEALRSVMPLGKIGGVWYFLLFAQAAVLMNLRMLRSLPASIMI